MRSPTRAMTSGGDGGVRWQARARMARRKRARRTGDPSLACARRPPMRLTFVMICAALSATPLAARVTVPRHLIRSEIAKSVVAQPVDARIVARLFEQTTHAQTVGDNRSSRFFIIPAAGSVAGANGTFFRSDVTLINYSALPEDVIAVFWPNGQSTTPSVAAGVRITLPAEKAVTYIDFAASVLGKAGLDSHIR